MTWRAFRALVAGAIIIAGALAFMLPLHAFAGGCGAMVASWYGAESGNRTANGEHFNGNSLTAAHRSLPFGTKLRVIYRGKSVVVRVNDRGPYIKGRDLDLSRAAAQRIGLLAAGYDTVQVCRVN